MSDTLKILQQAVETWYSVTSCPVSRTGTVTLRDFHLQGEAEQVAKLLALDETGVSAYMLLRVYWEERLKNTAFTAHELLINPQGSGRRLQDLGKVQELLNHPDVLEEVEEFYQSLRQAVRHYGAEPDEDLLKDQTAIAVLRRDALSAFHGMFVYQFVSGESSPLPLGFNPGVYEFWNIPSLIRCLRGQQHPGITLCLIRSPDVLESFFAFAISDGDNLTLLVDKERDKHPAQKDMRRRPDRAFLARAAQYHFPYELTEVKSQDSSSWGVATQTRTGLVPYQTRAVKLADIQGLRPETVTWLAMMFSLLSDRKKARTPAQLSYTTHMLRESDALVDAQSQLVRQGLYRPLVAPTLTNQDMTEERLADQWIRTPTRHHDWMIARYADQVPEQVLNLLGEREHQLLLTDSKYGPGGVLASARDVWNRPKGPQFRVMDPLDFGTETDILRDQVWTARHNQMVAIQRLADREFADTRNEISSGIWTNPSGATGWYPQALQRNRDFLLEAVARGELWSEAKVPDSSLPTLHPVSQPARHNLIDRYRRYPEICLGPAYDRCAVTGTRTKERFYFVPQVAEDLALLCGCQVADLPWQLQHWTREEPYSGNPLLQRIDPKDWVLHNPWSALHLDVVVPISQAGYNKIRKMLGLPRQPIPPGPS